MRRRVPNRTAMVWRLSALGLEIANRASEPDLLALVPEEVRALLGADLTALAVTGAGSTRVDQVASASRAQDLPGGGPRVDRGLLESLLHLPRVLNLGDVAADPRYSRLLDSHHCCVQALLVVPVPDEDAGPLGLLLAAKGPGGEAFSGEDERVAVTVAGFLSAAVRGLRRQAKLERSERAARQVARESQALEERYRGLLENANDALFIISPNDGRFLEVNRMAATLTGYSPDDLLKMGVADLHGADSAALALGRLRDTIERGAALFDDLPLIRKDGTRLDVQFSSTLLHLGDQQLVESIARDVTHERERERELQLLYRDVQSKAERLSLLGQLARDLGSNLDAQGVLANAVAGLGRVVACDGAAMFQQNAETGTFDSGPAIASPAGPPGLPDYMKGGELVQQVAQGVSAQVFNDLGPGAAPGDPALVRYGYRSALLVPIVTEGSVSAVLGAFSRRANAFAPQHVEAADELASHLGVALRNARLFRDLGRTLEELWATQRFMVQAEKLAAIGELAAGVAHELNSPLTGVIGYVELLLLDPLLEPAVKERLELVTSEAQRAARIVQNLLYVARRQGPQRAPLDINDLLARIMDLRARGLATHNVQLLPRLEAELPPLLVDRDQMQSVFLNLLQNAEQAIAHAAGHGTLTVTTSQEGAFARIDVSDDGPGILPEHLGKVFDPFFTTKEPGEGTGLGLSICRGVVASHGGQITVDSTPGIGTTFTVLLPLASLSGAAPAADPPFPTPEQSPPPPHIMVVDSDGTVLDLATATLRKAGYRASAFMTAEEALEHLHGEPFDLLLLDIQSQEMGGGELFRTLSEQHPDMAQRVVFMTGDTVPGATQRLLEGSGRPVIARSYDSAGFLDTIARALGG